MNLPRVIRAHLKIASQLRSPRLRAEYIASARRMLGEFVTPPADLVAAVERAEAEVQLAQRAPEDR